MCLTWARKYSLCDCIHEIATTHCPPGHENECIPRIAFVQQDDIIECRNCSKRADIERFNALLSEHDEDNPSNEISSPDESDASPSGFDSSTHPHIVSNIDTNKDFSSDDSEEEVVWHDNENNRLTPEETDTGSSSDYFTDAAEHQPSNLNPEESSGSSEGVELNEGNTYSCADSRTHTPFNLDLESSERLNHDVVYVVDAPRECRPVEVVFPHYRARRGPSETLTLVPLSEFLLFGFVAESDSSCT